MALILSIETSTKVCSVAIHKNEILLATVEVHINQSHASKLALLINDVTQRADVDFSQIGAIAISAGPGSYTGLRIGASMAKGLCYALNIPLVSINTLELLACQMARQTDENALLCPMIDARRMEVYSMVVSTNLDEILPVAPRIIEEGSFNNLLEKSIVFFFGDGSDKCKKVINHVNAYFVDGVYPQASKIGELAYRKLNAGQIEDVAVFEPLYLKEFLIRSALQN